MPSRQQCLSSLISRVTAPTAYVFYRCMCGCGALKKDVCTAKATVRRPVVSSRHLYAWSFEGRKRDFSDTSVRGKGQVGCW